ncbi:TIGR03086 family protein [Kineococcus sp. T13]|uniref:TIGR03086 family metal-binding protein n=1 Tax=Kineococcus vitellinus TaxID=2696565 RepID=UPI001412241C|nr:TIGR03086 family metal-binding protein [Kineococcus vitellinus]NAZ74536.1 TIGR03086 family protein [Kineococcus vitellinus]
MTNPAPAPGTAPDPAAAAPPSDPRPLMGTAMDVVERLLVLVGPADLDAPTPCEGWDVRDLLGHLVAVTRRVAHIARGGRPADLPTVLESVPGGDWAAAWRAGRADLEAAWADDDLLARTVVHPAGEMPAAVAGTIYVQEFTVHAGDLAVALGRTDLLDEDLARRMLDVSTRFLPASPRGGPVPFGPVVEVPADAPAHVRLAAWLGRTAA